MSVDAQQARIKAANKKEWFLPFALTVGTILAGIITSISLARWEEATFPAIPSSEIVKRWSTMFAPPGSSFHSNLDFSGLTDDPNAANDMTNTETTRPYNPIDQIRQDSQRRLKYDPETARLSLFY